VESLKWLETIIYERPQRLSMQGVAARMEALAIQGATRISLAIQQTMAEAEAQIHRGTNITVISPAMVRDRLPLPVHVFVMAKP
jgi:hypothetical protein